MRKILQSSQAKRSLFLIAVFLLAFQIFLFILNANSQKEVQGQEKNDGNVDIITNFVTGSGNQFNSSEELKSAHSKMGEKDEKEEKEGPLRKLALICILHVDKLYAKRAVLREYYQLSKTPDVDLVFVLGRPSAEYEKMVQAEMNHFKDIIVLDIEENLEKGKTLDMFEYLAKRFGTNSTESVRYDIVMKADDDSLMLLKPLARYLRTLKKKELYGGVLMGVGGQDPTYFMQGRGYFLSFDLVEWLPTSDYPRKHIHGYEDANVGRWITHYGLKWENWVQTDSFIDIRIHKISSSTTLIHPVKDSKTWIELGEECTKLGLYE